MVITGLGNGGFMLDNFDGIGKYWENLTKNLIINIDSGPFPIYISSASGYVSVIALDLLDWLVKLCSTTGNYIKSFINLVLNVPKS